MSVILPQISAIIRNNDIIDLFLFKTVSFLPIYLINTPEYYTPNKQKYATQKSFLIFLQFFPMNILNRHHA